MGFSVSPAGAVLLELHPEESLLLHGLLQQLPSVLEAGPGDPATQRLLPNAYPDDEAAAAEFRTFTAAGLIKRKLANAARVAGRLRPGRIEAQRGPDELGAEEISTAAISSEEIGHEEISPAEISAEEISAEEIDAWLKTLTDLRLILASRLGIQKDGDPGEPDDLLRSIYDWLAYLQDSLLEALEKSG